VDLVVGVQLFLQLDDALVTLVQAARQCDNDVTLLYQKLLEPDGGVLVLA
jgi:hypothetical protein